MAQTSESWRSHVLKTARKEKSEIMDKGREEEKTNIRWVKDGN